MAKTIEEKIYKELVTIRHLIEDELRRQQRERNEKELRDLMIMETRQINGGKQNDHSFNAGRTGNELNLLSYDIPKGEKKE